MTGEQTDPSVPPRLFVYGTLAPGRPNAHVLAELPGTWTPATTRGHLVDQGWGAALGCPALVPHPDAPDVVPGVLLTSDALATHWERLDEFEGDSYQRVTVEVTVGDGTRRPAQTYALRPPREHVTPGS